MNVDLALLATAAEQGGGRSGSAAGQWQWQNRAGELTMMEVTPTMALNDRRMWWHCRMSGEAVGVPRAPGSSSGSCSLTRHSWRDLSTGITWLPWLAMLKPRRSSFMTMMMRSAPSVYQISMRWEDSGEVMEVLHHIVFNDSVVLPMRKGEKVHSEKLSYGLHGLLLYISKIYFRDGREVNFVAGTLVYNVIFF